MLVDTLVAAGLKRIYGLVGDSLNGVTDSIRPRKDLQWVPGPTRRNWSVCRRRTSAANRKINGLCQKLRSGQSPFDQRPL